MWYLKGTEFFNSEVLVVNEHMIMMIMTKMVMVMMTVTKVVVVMMVTKTTMMVNVVVVIMTTMTTMMMMMTTTTTTTIMITTTTMTTICIINPVHNVYIPLVYWLCLRRWKGWYFAMQKEEWNLTTSSWSKWKCIATWLSFRSLKNNMLLFSPLIDTRLAASCLMIGVYVNDM